MYNGPVQLIIGFVSLRGSQKGYKDRIKSTIALFLSVTSISQFLAGILCFHFQHNGISFVWPEQCIFIAEC